MFQRVGSKRTRRIGSKEGAGSTRFCFRLVPPGVKISDSSVRVNRLYGFKEEGVFSLLV